MSAVVPLHPTRSNADLYRASTDAAGMCGEIVKRTARNIQGRRYVQVEGWQAIAVAHGCIASAGEVERVNDEGAGGFRAIGTVRRMSDGVELCRAEGFIGDDEGMWAKRPVYARRAMVQTRAISRACRSAFAHVVVMIDGSLSTTPAEEVPEGGFSDTHEAEFVEVTPQPVKSAHQARKDGDFERLSASLNACADEAALSAWAVTHKDDIGALPRGWQTNMREAWVAKRDELRTRAAEADADPFGVLIEAPEGDFPGDWTDYRDQILLMISSANSTDEIGAVQVLNLAGIARCAEVLDGVQDALAAAVEARTAFLEAQGGD